MERCKAPWMEGATSAGWWRWPKASGRGQTLWELHPQHQWGLKLLGSGGGAARRGVDAAQCGAGAPTSVTVLR